MSITAAPTRAAWWRDWWVLPLFLVEFFGSLGANHAAPAAWRFGAAAGLGVLATLFVLVWRRQAYVAVLGNAVLVCVYAAIDLASGPIMLTPLLAAFLVGRARPLRVAWPPVAGGVVVIVAGLLGRSAWPDWSLGQGIAQSLVMVAGAAAAVAIGTAVRTRDEARAERAHRAATEERLRMAQDLHDGVGHGLAVVAMQAGVALHVLDHDPAAARASLEAIRDTSKESLEALRRELSTLAPTENPPPRAPRRRLADLPVLVDRVRAGGLVVNTEMASPSLTDDLEETAYAVVQEALTNVLRHAGAGSARVRIGYGPGAVRVTVANPSGGSAPVGPGAGLGIPGMRERVEVLGGSLRAGPTAQGGFEVHAILPTEEVP